MKLQLFKICNLATDLVTLAMEKGMKGLFRLRTLYIECIDT